MYAYHDQIMSELATWQKQMQRRPSVLNAVAKKVQDRINRIIPEKVHAAITRTIKEMVRGVLFGAKHTTLNPPGNIGIEEIEQRVQDRIKFYKHTAAAEGGIAGAGGFLLAVADFPVLLAIKIKMLFDIAALYGFDVNDYRERVYILHIFQLAFSSQQHRQKVFEQITNWKAKLNEMPADVHDFDWRSFQQEYRDYIDLAKLAQLIPGVGAVVGVVVNYQLLKKLGATAMNAYRMRRLETKQIG
ncbi:EcsC family protein [Segetibacter sp. 3557_3]|uniref:EcsC family protein n=1 Tax=Segetibacter sp. 3557_3 TaxID=2547429 RepID=UPI00105863D2|nr:EcsC family protein [Segetibacter sp. 3557_3]TDH25608.1 EcsC family protein [Segetibacter sp. 3557_3]